MQISPELGVGISTLFTGLIGLATLYVTRRMVIQEKKLQLEHEAKQAASHQDSESDTELKRLLTELREEGRKTEIALRAEMKTMSDLHRKEMRELRVEHREELQKMRTAYEDRINRLIEYIAQSQGQKEARYAADRIGYTTYEDQGRAGSGDQGPPALPPAYRRPPADV